jgi:ABC-type transporter Mla subunit MlaD
MEDHEQWLRSMESNQSQFAANLAEVNRTLDKVGRRLDTVTETLATFTASFAQALVQLATRVDDIAEEHLALERLVRDYIRSQRDGGQQS